MEKRPGKFYYICSKNKNYMTQEIIVSNWFGDNAVLTEIVNRIPFQAMTNKMTGNWHDGLVKDEQKAENGRGNLRMDSGFSMTSRVVR